MSTNKNESVAPFNLSFEYTSDYLYAYVSGTRDSYEISKQYWQEIAAECKKVECKKLLIEEDIAEIVSMGEMYQIASEIPFMGFVNVRIAFVDRYIEHQDLNQFGEIVATNRGIVGKIFNDIEEAKKWLLTD